MIDYHLEHVISYTARLSLPEAIGPVAGRWYQPCPVSGHTRPEPRYGCSKEDGDEDLDVSPLPMVNLWPRPMMSSSTGLGWRSRPLWGIPLAAWWLLRSRPPSLDVSTGWC
jgi:hypothetical protein